MSRLQGKTAVITAAARGIGRAIAVAYAREGVAIMGIDLGPHHIWVNALMPGLIATDMTMNETRLKEAHQDYRSDPPADLSPEQVAEVRGQRTAMRLPWLAPDDMAPIAVFLGSDEARHLSGASFDVDAGDSALFTA